MVLAQIDTVMFDKTGTLTVGGARLVAIEAAPGHSTDEFYGLPRQLSRPPIMLSRQQSSMRP